MLLATYPGNHLWGESWKPGSHDEAKREGAKNETREVGYAEIYIRLAGLGSVVR